MRLEVNFRCSKGTAINFNYNHHLSNIIAESTEKVAFSSDEQKPQSLHTFSQLYLKDYSISGGKMISGSEQIQWYISSPDHSFLETIVKGLTICGYVYLGDTLLEFTQARLLEHPYFYDEMDFTCMSPITIAHAAGGGKEQYSSIDGEFFGENLRQDLIRKYYIINKSFPKDENLSFYFDSKYMQKKSRPSRLINYDGKKIMGYMIPFKVKGSKELIEIGYHAGFGNKNDCGFGMVKVWHNTRG
ncbi:CRISPR-associated endoribonuclease Cas6 [Proteinivorax hydrogeniformans]|uniref:CRISPR-associated endoribonuclease n=1 Tax=Proteinivorax hydrogeniformans TaxID=1826727 RepID=A0AAU8HSL6_9FIRM